MTNLVEHGTDVAPLVLAKGLRFAAVFAEYAREQTRARAYCEQSLALAREADDPSSIAWSLSTLALYVESPGNPVGAVVLFDQALALFREIGDAWGTSHTLRRSAIILMLQGD